MQLYYNFFFGSADHTPQSVGLLWMTDQHVAETATLQHTTLTRDKTSVPPLGFEPTIWAGEWPQTYALDHAATATAYYNIYSNKLFKQLCSVFN